MQAIEIVKASGIVRHLHAVCGWFLIYLAAVELFPIHFFFGRHDVISNIVKFVMVGVPRGLELQPASAVALLVGQHFSDAALLLLGSIPVFLLLWAGTTYWWPRQKLVAAVALIVVAVVIVKLIYSQLGVLAELEFFGRMQREAK